MIQIKSLYKSFDTVEILKGVSTTFEKGKTNLSIGQSGSGKTVLLKCLRGLFLPEEGEIVGLFKMQAIPKRWQFPVFQFIKHPSLYIDIFVSNNS